MAQDTSDIDALIEQLNEKLHNNEVPIRIRDKRAKSNDGYPEYVTQAEVIANGLITETYRTSIQSLKELKKILEEQ